MIVIIIEINIKEYVLKKKIVRFNLIFFSKNKIKTYTKE